MRARAFRTPESRLASTRTPDLRENSGPTASNDCCARSREPISSTVSHPSKQERNRLLLAHAKQISAEANGAKQRRIVSRDTR